MFSNGKCLFISALNFSKKIKYELSLRAISTYSFIFIMKNVKTLKYSGFVIYEPIYEV